jgi:CubicO group peptidase (beta-lactamase class C family)
MQESNCEAYRSNEPRDTRSYDEKPQARFHQDGNSGEEYTQEKTPRKRRLTSCRSACALTLIVFALLSLFSCTGTRSLAKRVPGAGWEMYATPEEAGWASEKLAVARELYEKCGSDAFMAVYDGAVVVAWGDVSRRFMCHSVRKSYLSALIGIFVAEGKITLDKTLAELGIDDEPPLTDEEKQARVIDLLRSRSGVFHAAAYETPAMKEKRPKRGSKRPDEIWYYNNWDFNALSTIFSEETGASIFDEFEKRIAHPLQMEDFRLMDTYYHLEKQHSIHPAYPFRMSARDMARFGLLYLRNGKWKNRDVIPEEWVEASRYPYTRVTDWEGWGYGYMWWVDVGETDRKLGMYAAMGYGGHMIAVLPQENMVFVNRANTYLGKSTARSDLLQLIDKVLDAKVSPPKARPRLIPLSARPGRTTPPPRIGVAGLDTAATTGKVGLRLENYEEEFKFDNEEISVRTIPYVIGDMIGESVRIQPDTDAPHLLMTDNLGQKFMLIPRSPTEFVVQDMEIPVFFDMDAAMRPVRIRLDATPAWRISGERVSGSNP